MNSEKQITEQGEIKPGRWVKGMKSPNAEGARKMRHSGRTIRGKLERWLLREMTAKKLTSLYGNLTAREQAKFFCEVLPLVLSKPQGADLDQLSDGQLDELYSRVEAATGLKLKATG